MTFLRGKSTSYSRFVIPQQATMSLIDKVVEAHEFTGIPEGQLEANGFCSYRNLLDASIDRGLLEGRPNLWITGLRRDVKKAPPALIAAQTARELADLHQRYPNAGKDAEKQIKAKVREELNQKAQARPAHAAVMVNLSTRLGYVDGVASAHQWVKSMLTSGDMDPNDPAAALYSDSTLNRDYLAWCAWRAGNGVDTPVSPTGDISFREPKDSGATFDGQHDMNALLNYWMGEQKATIGSLGLIYAVPFDEDSYNVDVVIQAAGLKVCALEFPEFINEFPGTLDQRLGMRLGFIEAFEAELAKDYVAFGQKVVDRDLPAAFLALVGGEL